MKIKSRNLLTAILALLCAVTVALGISFALPENKANLAIAASTDEPISMNELDTLAQSAGADNMVELVKDILNGTTLQANKFGGHVVAFGGKEWWPVYFNNSDGKAVLTLWLKTSLGNYAWSDGTYSTGLANPKSNNYATSWINAAINAGKTSLGYYYGSYSNGAGTTCTQYQNNQKSASAVMAPTDFTALEDFASGGKFDEYILNFGDLDKVFLPSEDEVKNGGIWGCTTTQWAGATYWLRTSHPSYYGCAYPMTGSGVVGYDYIYALSGVRPAICVDVTKLCKVNEPEDVDVIYNGLTQTLDNVATDKKEWYDNDLMDITYPSANAGDMKDVGTYSVKVELKANLGFSFKGTPDESIGETETIRYFDFKIKPLGIAVPIVQNATVTYKAGEYEFGDRKSVV